MIISDVDSFHMQFKVFYQDNWKIHTDINTNVLLSTQ